jgi:hypothetical protein
VCYSFEVGGGRRRLGGMVSYDIYRVSGRSHKADMILHGLAPDAELIWGSNLCLRSDSEVRW